MNAALTRLTMIAATLAAAVTVQAAPPVPHASGIVTLPMVTVVGKREPAMQVVTLPMVTVTGKRAATVVALEESTTTRSR